jgi:hypothetical protein
MSTWRKKAIECLPEHKKEFEKPDCSIYTVFFQMLTSVLEAHQQNNQERLMKIYSYAEWCFRQKREDLWNAAGVAFYEHLGDKPETLAAITTWIKKDIYLDIRSLLELRMDDAALKELDDFYGIVLRKNTRKHRKQ